MTTTQLSPLQEAAKEMRTSQAELDELDRDMARMQQRRNAAEERARVARLAYDRLMKEARTVRVA